jgi:hypothetical protein
MTSSASAQSDTTGTLRIRAAISSGSPHDRAAKASVRQRTPGTSSVSGLRRGMRGRAMRRMACSLFSGVASRSCSSPSRGGGIKGVEACPEGPARGLPRPPRNWKWLPPPGESTRAASLDFAEDRTVRPTWKPGVPNGMRSFGPTSSVCSVQTGRSVVCARSAAIATRGQNSWLRGSQEEAFTLLFWTTGRSPRFLP